MGFMTVAEFKALPLGLKDTLLAKFGDDAIQSYIDTATTQIENYCKRVLASAEVTDPMFDGRNNVEAILRQYPVTEITKVAWEDDGGQSGEHDPSSFFLYSSGRLRWKSNANGGPFIYGRHYTITYTAGFDPVPGPIKHACGLWVTELMQPTFATPSGKDNSDLVALSSEQIGELLDSYRRKGAA